MRCSCSTTLRNCSSVAILRGGTHHATHERMQDLEDQDIQAQWAQEEKRKKLAEVLNAASERVNRDTYRHNTTVRKIMDIGGIDGMVKFPYGLAISKDKHIAVLDRRFVKCVSKTAKGMQFVVYAAPLGAKVVRCGWLPSHCTTLARYGDVYVRSEWDVTTLNLISLILAEIAFDSAMTATAENAPYRAVQDAMSVAASTLAGGGQKEDSVDSDSKTFRTREEARKYARAFSLVPTKITKMGEKSWRVSVKTPETPTPKKSEGYDLDPHDVDTDDYDDWYYGFFDD